jgi:hypothetical protein
MFRIEKWKMGNAIFEFEYYRLIDFSDRYAKILIKFEKMASGRRSLEIGRSKGGVV